MSNFVSAVMFLDPNNRVVLETVSELDGEVVAFSDLMIPLLKEAQGSIPIMIIHDDDGFHEAPIFARPDPQTVLIESEFYKRKFGIGLRVLDGE